MNKVTQLYPMGPDTDMNVILELHMICMGLQKYSNMFTELQRHAGAGLLYTSFMDASRALEAFQRDFRHSILSISLPNPSDGDCA